MISDPIRLLEDPSAAAGLRGDLAHASNAAVQGLDHGAVLVGLESAIAAEAAAASTAAAGAGSMAKIAIAVVLLGGGAAAIWGATRGDHDAPVVPLKAASTVAEAPEAASPRVAARATTPVETPRVQQPIAEPELEAVLVPEEESVEAPARTPRPRSTRPSEAKVDASDRVLREARLVADAREALGTSPSKALSLAQEAAQEFPRGQLIEEREAIAIRALAKLGRTEAARLRAEKFLDRHGSGPHAEAVRRAIGVQEH